MIDVNKKTVVLALCPVVFLIVVLSWYRLLYLPKMSEIKTMRQDLDAIQRKMEFYSEESFQAARTLREQQAIAERYHSLMAAVPHGDQVPSVMARIAKMGRVRNVRMVSIRPDTSGMFSDDGTQQGYDLQVKQVRFEMHVQGTFMNISRWLSDLSGLPFFRSCQAIRIRTDEGHYPGTEADITCAFTFL